MSDNKKNIAREKEMGTIPENIPEIIAQLTQTQMSRSEFSGPLPQEVLKNLFLDLCSYLFKTFKVEVSTSTTTLNIENPIFLFNFLVNSLTLIYSSKKDFVYNRTFLS